MGVAVIKVTPVITFLIVSLIAPLLVPVLRNPSQYRSCSSAYDRGQGTRDN
jgi:hypothetical protein